MYTKLQSQPVFSVPASVDPHHFSPIPALARSSRHLEVITPREISLFRASQGSRASLASLASSLESTPFGHRPRPLHRVYPSTPDLARLGESRGSPSVPRSLLTEQLRYWDRRHHLEFASSPHSG